MTGKERQKDENRMEWPTGRRIAFDAAAFDPATAHQETAELNAAILARLSAAPDIWSFSMEEVRTARAAGRGSYPLLPPDPDVIETEIAGPAGAIGLRILHPKTRGPRGVYLHFHGGGWVMGAARENDARLRGIAEATGLSTVSVDYRLAPENPWPAANDDCEEAALWLIGEGGRDLERGFLAVGGESAGAHLAVTTLLRLRDGHGLSPFSTANLTAGCYDLSLTPSVRNWGDRRLILRTRDVENFVDRFIPAGCDLKAPDISPLYASLDGMPPALFSCGTADLLIDDTLFMATRWLASGNHAETDIEPGGCHVYQAFDTAPSRRSLRRIADFLNARIAQARPDQVR